jgi:hypothetical protein
LSGIQLQWPLTAPRKRWDGNKAFSQSDDNGTMDLQYQCAYGVTNWGYQLSPQLQSIITGPVHEDGLSWTRNGTAQSQNSPHDEPADYQFHGTLNPTHNNDEISYWDHYAFPVKVNGETGRGDLDVTGEFHTVDR